MKINSISHICCIGAGYVGGPTMSVIADRCPDIEVTVIDINKDRIDAWNEKDLRKIPVYEPGLDEVLKRARGRNLFFSTAIEASIAKADIVFISVNTPIKSKGVGAGQASDIRWVEASARQVAKYAKGKTIVVEKSTLPVRTAAAIKSILETPNKNISEDESCQRFSVLSNPEFLAEGTAIKDLEEPDRVLIGGDDSSAIEALKSIYLRWVPKEQILCTNLWSSELSKLISNAFLAQRISSINAVSALCEVTGADVREVSKAIGADHRIGKKFLEAGPGFGGSCFKKDILNLVYLCNHFGLPEVASYWEQVIELNAWQQQRIYRTILHKLFGTVNGKKLAILGFAFKADTNDTRESPSLRIALDLLEEGALLSIHDPKVSEDKIFEDLNRNEAAWEGKWSYVKTISEAVIEADAVLILTDWKEYAELDWFDLAKKMRAPAWVFDTRSIVEPSQIKSAGLNFWRVGDGVN
ncbi:nucleotide sugar dehydrogenase [Prochlorococcus sp. MIT 1223]|uniref:nucleotide sugar dehydrogenase n=1 Tax=Prochlorococcus sp. MIT 1223 TaxID=3096217 RepID=UPI002A748957|nr:nucleotide sugar dehydrogenase [Prochlorococcus sp. MIT 1223]